MLEFVYLKLYDAEPLPVGEPARIADAALPGLVVDGRPIELDLSGFEPVPGEKWRLSRTFDFNHPSIPQEMLASDSAAWLNWVAGADRRGAWNFALGLPIEGTVDDWSGWIDRVADFAVALAEAWTHVRPIRDGIVRGSLARHDEELFRRRPFPGQVGWWSLFTDPEVVAALDGAPGRVTRLPSGPTTWQITPRLSDLLDPAGLPEAADAFLRRLGSTVSTGLQG